MKTTELISSVKKKVKAIDPGAKVILFGSRARGDQNPNSDWDFLILSSRNTTPQFKRDIRNSLVDTELESEQVISTIFFPLETWPNYRITPLFQNIEKEGREV
jgi:predicted nucleotidyltransferase